MPVDNTLFMTNYNIMLDAMYPLDCAEDSSGIVRSSLTWSEAKAKPGYLDRLIKRSNKDMYHGKMIWFQGEDPYKGSKPFEILWVGLENMTACDEGVTVVLVVRGQQSARIKKKWSGKLSVTFGYPVQLIWEEEAQ